LLRLREFDYEIGNFVCFDSKQTLGRPTIVADFDAMHCSFSGNAVKRLFHGLPWGELALIEKF